MGNFNAKYLWLALWVLLLYACSETNENADQKTALSQIVTDSISDPSPEMGDLEKQLIKQGLVNIGEVIPGILVELKYSTTDNFMGRDMYGELDAAYCQPDVAEKLARAQSRLKQINNAYTLLIYDAVRPLHIQQFMWDSLDVPLVEKRNFLSDPALGSLHNYGAAIDLTIADANGHALDMGTPYDYIGELAHPALEQQWLSLGKLTNQQVSNRLLLRKVMLGAGFMGIDTEWWHFNSCTREMAKLQYQVIE